MTRLPIPRNIMRRFWSRRRTNTVRNTSNCQSMDPKVLRATTPSPQRLLDLVNLLLIHMICPTVMMNTWHIKMWLKWHPDAVIAQHAYWQPQDCIWIHRLKYQITGGKLIQIIITTTPTPWRLAVHFGCQILPTGGTSKRNHARSTPISPMWQAAYYISYHTVSKWSQVFPLGKTLPDGGSRKPQPRPFVK